MLEWRLRGSSIRNPFLKVDSCALHNQVSQEDIDAGERPAPSSMGPMYTDWRQNLSRTSQKQDKELVVWLIKLPGGRSVVTG